jgi:mannitol/fructose-specific phosphotransferase system IIA component (Ntr-type)
LKIIPEIAIPHAKPNKVQPKLPRIETSVKGVYVAAINMYMVQ